MRARIDLGYDGAAFHGWARQPGLRTVQGDLEAALDTVLRVQGSQVTVAGRTDTGVHARGQVAHADLDQPAEPLERLTRRLNGVLADDVRVHRVTQAPAGFDARFGALWRRYAYRLADGPEAVDPLARGHVVRWPRELDASAMTEAATGLLGEHDFAAFCKRRKITPRRSSPPLRSAEQRRGDPEKPGATTIRRLLDLTWARDDAGVLVGTVRADAFCHSMVRALVGCLVAVGEARRPVGWPAQVLAGRERDGGVTVMPAHGLTLEEVRYPPDDELAAQAERARVVRT